MPNIQNPHAKRLYDSLLNHTDQQTAENIVCKVNLTKTPTEKKKLEWVESVCNSLENTFCEEKIKHIRMCCACGPSKGRMDELKKIYTSSGSLADFAVNFNKTESGAKFWVENDVLFFSYPTCYCSMVKKTDKLISKNWCYCTLGYTKKMFEYVLDCKVIVELLESVKQGDSRCVIKIERIEQNAEHKYLINYNTCKKYGDNYFRALKFIR